MMHVPLGPIAKDNRIKAKKHGQLLPSEPLITQMEVT